MTTQTPDAGKALVTRFDTRETEDGTELRLFNKRTKVFAMGEEDVVREDYADALTAFIAEKPRTVDQVCTFLDTEAGDDDEDGEADEGGSIVPAKYRIRYGATQRCGDQIAETLSAYVTLPRAGKKNDIDGGLDRAKLREVAEANGLGAKLTAYENGGKDGEGLNGGLLRMNVSNILRGMHRRGERVVIGDVEWTENLDNPKHPANHAARKAERAAAAAKAKAEKAKAEKAPAAK